MYEPLVSCPCCNRHVRVSEVRCPFCTGALPVDLANRVIPPATGRLSRAAAFVFGASLAVTACGSEVTNESSGGVGSATSGGGTGGASSSSGTSSTTSTSSGGVDPDGGTSVDEDAGPGKPDAGPPDDGGGSADYGSPPPVDGGMDSGGWQPLYGAAPPLPSE